MQKSRKRTFKTTQGVLKRIYRRDFFGMKIENKILKINKVFERVLAPYKFKYFFQQNIIWVYAI